jgi:hypothetical protein
MRKLKHDRDVLRLIGLDVRGLSDTEIAKGAKLAARVSREDCGLPPAARVNKPKAIAEWQAFLKRIGQSR